MQAINAKSNFINLLPYFQNLIDLGWYRAEQMIFNFAKKNK